MGNTCACTLSGGKISIGTGLIFFNSGAKMKISTALSIDYTASDTLQYVYAYNDTSLNSVRIVADETEPTESMDTVMLCTIKSGVLTDMRDFSQARVSLPAAATVYQYEKTLAFKGGEEIQRDVINRNQSYTLAAVYDSQSGFIRSFAFGKRSKKIVSDRAVCYRLFNKTRHKGYCFYPFCGKRHIKRHSENMAYIVGVITMDIKFTAECDRLTSDISAAISGNVNYYKCEFTFSDEWQGLSKYAVFSKKDKAYTVEIKDGCCFIPKEVLQESGNIAIGVFGTNGSETDYLRISTNPVTALVSTGAYKEGDTPEPPTPDLWEEYLNQVANAADNVIPYINKSDNHWYVYDPKAQKYVDSGVNSVGAKGDKGDKGDRGEQGIQGERGLQGLQGVQGDKGDTGEKGEKGDQGIQGIQGVKGDDGYTPIRGTDYWTETDQAAISADLDNKVANKADKLKSIPSKDVTGYPITLTDQLAGEKPIKLNIYGGKNLIPYPYVNTTMTKNGITFTDNGDGTITVDGTATADTRFYCRSASD